MRKQLPVNGETRVHKTFLLFPKTIGNELRWLEVATWEKEYVSGPFGNGGCWIEVRWIDQEKA